MNPDVRFEEPPETRRDRRDHSSATWQAIADTLRTRPGEWAVVAEQTHGALVGHIQNAEIKAFRPAGSFEAKCQYVANDDQGRRRFKVWARALP